MELVLHDDLNAFVKSKPLIDGGNGPQIQQFNWYADSGELVGISCKLKSADHLNLAFGDGVAGPDGSCQDMNRAVFEAISARVPDPVYEAVNFDPRENYFVTDVAGATGPAWLAPAALTSADGDTLTIHTKGFINNFTDPAHADRPVRFRGLHYCHFVAPVYFEALLRGQAEAGARVGADIE